MSDTAWQARAEAIIDEHIRQSATITYADLADAAGVPSPQRIHRLTGFLETLMERDAQSGSAIRAAIVVSRTSGKPARGFYEKLAALGISPNQNLNPDDKTQD